MIRVEMEDYRKGIIEHYLQVEKTELLPHSSGRE